MDFTYLAPPEDAHRVDHSGIENIIITQNITLNMEREKKHQGKYMKE